MDHLLAVFPYNFELALKSCTNDILDTFVFLAAEQGDLHTYVY